MTSYIGASPETTIARVRYLYTAVTAQNTFTTATDGQVLSYESTNNVDVFVNGVLLVPTTDYAAETGSSIVLVEAADADDKVEVLTYESFQAANYLPTTSGTITGSLTVNNNLIVDTNTLYVDSTNNNVGIGTSSPSTTVDAIGSSTNGSGVVDTIRVRNTGTAVGDGGRIQFTSGSSTSGAGIAGYGTSLNEADLLFYAGGNTERMRVNSSGLNVTGSLTQSTGLVPNYDSGYVTFGGTSTTTVSHGLGTRPSICIITMYCNSSDAGYSTGDELVVCHEDGDGGRRHIGYWNSSQVKMRWNNSGMVSPTVSVSFWNASNWRYRVRCWK